eukprot:12917620-Prorocentrum_lima.AAC.1
MDRSLPFFQVTPSSEASDRFRHKGVGCIVAGYSQYSTSVRCLNSNTLTTYFKLLLHQKALT